MKPSQSTEQPVPALRNPIPREINWVMVSLLVIGVIHYVDIFLIATHRQEAAPSGMTQYLFESSMIVHVVFGTLFILACVAVRTGRNWLRIVVTVLLVIQVLAHLSLPTLIALLPGEAVAITAVQVISLLFEVAALFLLWRPRPIRLFFKGRKGEAGLQNEG